MRALRIHEYNKPLSLDNVSEPKISGDYDVIVEIKGAGVCRTDLHIIEGIWRDIHKPKLPFTLGHENVGVIKEKGKGVNWLDIGDHVILHPYISCRHCRACRAGNDMHCPNGRFPGLDGTDGGFADYLITSAFSAIKVPKQVDLVNMAPLADAGLTAYHAVKKMIPYLYPGSSAVVIGVGGLGHIAIQTLKALTPAKIIAIDIAEDKIKLAERLGANYAVLKGEPEDVIKLADGGADVVFDFVGEHGTPEKGLRMIRKGGIYSIIGYGGKVEDLTIDFISREITVVGNLVGTYNELSELVELYAQGKVKVEVSKYPFEDYDNALEDLAKGRILGRAVLTP